MGTKADEFDSAMRHVLTRNTPTVLKSFTSEIEYAMDNNVGVCKDWTPVTPRKAMSRMASILSGRAFVGLPLSRDEAWIEATVNYTGDVSRAWLILRFIPWPIRPVVAPFLPQVRSLLRQKATNVQKLAPLLAAKQSGVKSKNSNPGGEMIDWFVSQYKQPPNAQQLGRDQLLATFASIYNLSNALTYIAFDLAAADPQVIKELRQELLDVVGENGTIDKTNISSLRKLDSFARESQRLSPPSLVNIPRIVTNPWGLKLSTGEVIPKGTLVMIISHTINNNPELYHNPSCFDAFRFSNLRKQPGNELKYQHTTTGTDHINFGHGLWACPGRFFAAAEIKVVAAYILMHYDVKLIPGEEKPLQQHWGLAVLPNPTTQVLFKRRQQALYIMLQIIRNSVTSSRGDTNCTQQQNTCDHCASIADSVIGPDAFNTSSQFNTDVSLEEYLYCAHLSRADERYEDPSSNYTLFDQDIRRLRFAKSRKPRSGASKGNEEQQTSSHCIQNNENDNESEKKTAMIGQENVSYRIRGARARS
ncbi:MAG: hypothetical protein ASARMPREDX12_004425 [Alectoria sarmentosa]|nr:MAG: hypothetical protein ASARMPREDX12_004425 [Alectoria sarmentosa]